MKVQRGSLYIANLNAHRRAALRKVRPVLVVQSDLLNDAEHPSTWVLPCTTRLIGENRLRVALPRGIAGNREDCEVMLDRSRTIDNRLFLRALRPLPRSILREVDDKLRRLAEL